MAEGCAFHSEVRALPNPTSDRSSHRQAMHAPAFQPLDRGSIVA